MYECTKWRKLMIIADMSFFNHITGVPLDIIFRAFALFLYIFLSVYRLYVVYRLA